MLFLSDGVEVVEGSQFGGEYSGPLFLDQFHCTGDEESLSECDMFTEPGMHMCGHQHDVGIICQRKNMSIALVFEFIILICSHTFTYQLPVSVISTMVVVITTALRPYRATSAPAILGTHWTLISTLVLVSQCMWIHSYYTEW